MQETVSCTWFLKRLLVLRDRRLTWNLQSPPISALLSKQTGSRPSSRQHLIEERPLTPPPITAILFLVMVSRDLHLVSSGSLILKEWQKTESTPVRPFQHLESTLTSTGIWGDHFPIGVYSSWKGIGASGKRARAPGNLGPQMSALRPGTCAHCLRRASPRISQLRTDF